MDLLQSGLPSVNISFIKKCFWNWNGQLECAVPHTSGKSCIFWITTITISLNGPKVSHFPLLTYLDRELTFQIHFGNSLNEKKKNNNKLTRVKVGTHKGVCLIWDNVVQSQIFLHKQRFLTFFSFHVIFRK